MSGFFLVVSALGNSTAEEQRHDMFVQNLQRARELEERARAKEREAEGQQQYVVVIVEVDDPTWHSLADILMPDNEAQWQEYRDQGMVPIARGVVPRDLVRKGIELTVGIDTTKLPAVFTAVFAAGGISIYEASHGD